MVLFHDFKYFYGIFYIFGQATYYPINVKNQIKSKFWMFLPFILFSINILVCSMVFLKSEFHNVKQSRNIVVYSLRFTAFVPNFIVIFESLNHPYGIRAINHRLSFIYNFLRIKFKTQFQLHKFKSECFIDFCTCFGVITIATIIRMNILTLYDLNTEIAIFFMQMYKTLAILHALFYMNLFKFVLISINDGILKRDFGKIILSQVILNAESTRSNRLSMICLQQTRLIHLKLWEAMKVYNKYFGWSLLAIMLESIISSTNAFYGAFIHFADSENFIQLMIRKFVIIFVY